MTTTASTRDYPAEILRLTASDAILDAIASGLSREACMTALESLVAGFRASAAGDAQECAEDILQHGECSCGMHRAAPRGIPAATWYRAHAVARAPRGIPGLQCCGTWVRYPSPGQDTRCAGCGTTFTGGGSADNEVPALVWCPPMTSQAAPCMPAADIAPGHGDMDACTVEAPCGVPACDQCEGDTAVFPD